MRHRRIFLFFLITLLLTVLLAPSVIREVRFQERFCTSAVISPAISTNGLSIMWKNRDNPNRPYIPQVLVLGGGKYRFIGVATVGSSGISFGLNEAGLAVGNTYIEVVNEGGEIGNLALNRMILSNASSIDEAIELILNTYGKASGSSIVMADPRGVAVLDICMDIAYNLERTEEGWIVRSNHWRNVSSSELAKYEAYSPGESSIKRYEAAYSLIRDMAEDGGVSVIDMLKVAKSHVYGIGRLSICRHESSRWSIASQSTTVSSGVCVIYRDNPSFSVMWVSLGQPCICIYTPVFAAVAKLNISSIDYWSTEDVWRNNEKIRDIMYGDKGLYYSNKTLAYTYFNFTYRIEDALVDYVEVIWSNNSDPVNATGKLIGLIEGERLNITAIFLSCNRRKLAKAINLSIKYIYVILTVDLKALFHETGDIRYLNASHIVEGRLQAIEDIIAELGDEETVLTYHLVLTIALSAVVVILVIKKKKGSILFLK